MTSLVELLYAWVLMHRCNDHAQLQLNSGLKLPSVMKENSVSSFSHKGFLDSTEMALCV